MKKFATLGALVALAVPAVAHGTSTPTTTPSAQAQCRTELKAMGKQAFKDAYGTNRTKSNAFGKCVSHRTAKTTTAGTTARVNAAKACATERTADPAAFALKYGTGKKGKNAFGKCVSQTAKTMKATTVTTQVKAEISAAKQCKTERKADPAAFKLKYGTNAKKTNAFGKCVSKLAKAHKA